MLKPLHRQRAVTYAEFQIGFYSLAAVRDAGTTEYDLDLSVL